MNGKPNAYIAAVMGAIVVILVSVSVVLPILSAGAETERTFTNDGYFTYDVVDSDTNLTISFDPATPDVVTIGDKTVEMPDGTGNWTIAGSENFTVRYTTNASNSFLQVYGTAGYLAGDPGSATVVTVDVTDSNVVFHRSSSTSKTYTMGTHGFVLNPNGDGDLTLKYASEAAYIHADTEVYLCGTTRVDTATNDFTGVFGWGTYDDITLTSFYGNTSPNTVSFGDVTATVSAVSGYVDLYELEKFEFDITQNSATVGATYSYFVVPSEVTAEIANHPTGSALTIIQILPVLILVGVLLYVVGAFISGRRA